MTLPIIAMTAHAFQADRERCMQAGMNDYVTKPVEPKSLAAAVERWLPSAPAGLAEAASSPADGPVSRPAATMSEQAQNPVSPPIFDLPSFMQRIFDDRELASVIVAGFLEDMPRQILLLNQYLQADNQRDAERQAHTIKGASANLGGEALRMEAFELEKSCKAGFLPAARERLPQLNAEFERLKQVLLTEFPLT